MDTPEFLKIIGYQKPYDKSPIDAPEGWYGGSVEHTGGNIFCRRWRTWKDGEKAGDIGYEVIYDVNRSSKVACEKYQYNDDVEYYEHLSTEILKEAEYDSDYALAQAALSVMRTMNAIATDGETAETDETSPQVLRSRGHVVFDESTEDTFREIVAETLNTSDFIKTSIDSYSGLLLINEVYNSKQ